MYTSRRQFCKRSSASFALLLARLEGVTPVAQAAEPEAVCALDAGSSFAPFIGSFLAQIEPGSDSFVNETYAVELEAVMRLWSTGLCDPGKQLHVLEASLSAMVTASPLGAPSLQGKRSRPPLATEQAVFPAVRGFARDAYIAELRSYFAGFRSLETAQFEVAGIEARDAAPLTLRTEVVYDLVGVLADDRREERTGTWELTWRQAGEGGWSVTDWVALGESRSRLAGLGFVDVSHAVFGQTMVGQESSFEQQMSRGADHWRTVLDGATGIDVYGNHGVAVGDFDGDGLDDLYVCQAAGLPNRLYRNRGDGTFEDVTERAGVGVLDATSSALFADLNNNGLQDLIVIRISGPLLFINGGDGTFSVKKDAFQFARAPQGTFTGAAIADYNRDGLLDVYFCLYSYYQGLSEYRFPRPYYDAQNGPPNFLFRNQGGYRFEDVTVSSGMDQNNNRYSFACGWTDVNNDGWPDLYVVNDFGRKNLYRNRGDGTFSDVSAEAGVEDPGAGMSVCWFDYDNDGFDDLYVANMWTAEGRRISTQAPFLPAATDEVRRVYRKHARGNSLFHNAGDGTRFNDATDGSGTRIGRWSWSSDAWDFDHDGFPDLYVANGFVSGPKQGDLSSFFWRQVVARSLASGGAATDYEDAWSAINEFLRSDHSWSGYERNNFYANNGDGTFTESAGVLGLDFLEDGRSFALLDLDQDGRLEVVLKNRNAPQLRVLANRMNPLPPSLTVQLKGTKSNRDAIGAVVELATSVGRQRKTVTAGSGFLAQHTKSLSFGLGSAEDDASAISAVVHWPSGLKQEVQRLPAGHRVEITEGSASIKSVAFRPSPAYAGAVKLVQDDLSGPVETWLVEPVEAPEFTLVDQLGGKRRLADFRGKPLVLVLFREDCAQSQEQLRQAAALWPAWRTAGLSVLAVRVDSGATSEAEERWPFPVVAADESTSAIYNIFYRYLFERRREMPLPACFLLDEQGCVIKVATGDMALTGLLPDWRSAPRTSEARLQRALAFKGIYFGEPMRHNYFTYGVAYFRYGFLDQASRSFEQAIASKANHASSYYNLGLIALQQNDVSTAQMRLEKAVTLDPANANAWNNLGVVYGRKADYARALSSFEQALTLRPGHLLAIENEVKLLRFQGKLEAAQTLLEAALGNDPTQAELHAGLAFVLVDRHDLARARAEFEAAVALKPNEVQALNGLGVVLMKMGDALRAQEKFETCVEIAPAFDRPYLNLALLYLRAGDTKKAHDVLSQYLARQPGNADVERALKEVDSRR